MPLFGLDVSIKGYDIKQLFNHEQLFLSNISLLEIKFLLAREFRKKNNITILNRYETVLPTLVNHQNITVIDSLTEPIINSYSNILFANGHSDMFDCLIVATAMFLDTYLLSEDEKIHQIDNVKVINWSKFNMDQ